MVWFKNQGLGSFSLEQVFFNVASFPWGIAAGQLDGIYRADLVTVNSNGGGALSENINVLLHNGTTHWAGDLNQDGAFNGGDIDPFFTCLAGGNCR